MTVDGTDFRINEQHPFDAGWKSHKFNGPAVRYEVAVSIRGGDIVHINGPFKAGKWNDISIFRKKLKSMLLRGEFVEADKGYRGDSKCITPINVDPLFRVRSGKVRSRHETVNKRFKQWGALKQTFRHDVSKHGSVFTAVVVLTQLAISFDGEPLFEVKHS